MYGCGSAVEIQNWEACIEIAAHRKDTWPDSEYHQIIVYLESLAYFELGEDEKASASLSYFDSHTPIPNLAPHVQELQAALD